MSIEHGEHRTPNRTPNACTRTRSAEVSTEHRTVRENKVNSGRENASNPREVERPVQKVEETCRDVLGAYIDLSRRWKRDRDEVCRTSSTALGVCKYLCRRWKRDREGERRYEPRESTR